MYYCFSPETGAKESSTWIQPWTPTEDVGKKARKASRSGRALKPGRNALRSSARRRARCFHHTTSLPAGQVGPCGCVRRRKHLRLGRLLKLDAKTKSSGQDPRSSCLATRIGCQEARLRLVAVAVAALLLLLLLPLLLLLLLQLSQLCWCL
jgi:hypothetical protein